MSDESNQSTSNALINTPLQRVGFDCEKLKNFFNGIDHLPETVEFVYFTPCGVGRLSSLLFRRFSACRARADSNNPPTRSRRHTRLKAYATRRHG